ncbi:hypothetical protein LCGC14_2463330, partial [marine sediment metagenome]
MANLKILSKTVEYGIIKQDEADTAATAFKALGLDATKSWNDPGVAATNYRQVRYDTGSVVFDANPTIDRYISTAQNGIHDETAQFFIDSASGLATMTFAMPADQKTITPHLAGMLQTVTEDATTPFSKSMVCAGLTGDIDFTANGAPLVTVVMTDKASADDGIILEDAIISELTLDWDFLQKGVARLAQMSGVWAGTVVSFEQTMSGTSVTTTLTPYNDSGTFSFTTFSIDAVDSSALPFRKLTFNYAANITVNNVTTAGKPDQYDIKPEFTSTILLDYGDVSEKFLKNYITLYLKKLKQYLHFIKRVYGKIGKNETKNKTKILLQEFCSYL